MQINWNWKCFLEYCDLDHCQSSELQQVYEEERILKGIRSLV